MYNIDKKGYLDIFYKFVDNNVFLCWYHGWFRPAVVDS